MLGHGAAMTVYRGRGREYLLLHTHQHTSALHFLNLASRCSAIRGEERRRRAACTVRAWLLLSMERAFVVGHGGPGDFETELYPLGRPNDYRTADHALLQKRFPGYSRITSFTISSTSIMVSIRCARLVLSRTSSARMARTRARRFRGSK